MASSKIKGITIEIGGETTKLGKALSGVESQTKGLQSELKGVNSLLKLDPKNVELLTQKQELLAKSIEETKKKQELLTDTMKKIKSGEIEVTEEQYRDLQREIVSTDQKLEGLIKEQKNFGSVSKQQLQATAKEFEKIGTKAGELGKKVGVGLAGVVTGAVAGVEATREFRQDLGKLQTTFETTNHGATTATETFKTLYGILGEDDTAIEAANHLAVMSKNEESLKQWTDILTGVYATFGDSLPLEGLAEASNETAKVGTVTGNLADALNWAGISEDDFNDKLAKCNSEAEREKLIRETLTGVYSKASDKYKELNSDVIEGNKSQADLNLTMADFGNKLQPLVTKLKTFLAEGLEKISPVLNFIIDNINVLAPIILGFLGTLFALNIASKIQALIPIITSLNTVMKANPIGIVITIIGLLVTAFITLWNNCEGFRNFWIGLWDKIKNAVGTAIDFITGLFDTVVGVFETVINFFKDNWQGILLFIVNPFAGAFKLLYDNFDGFRDFVDGIVAAVKDFFVGLWDKIVEIFSSMAQWFYDNVIAPIYNFFMTWIYPIIDKVSEIVSKIIEIIVALATFIGTWIINSIVTPIINGIVSLYNQISSIIQAIWNFIVSVFQGAWNWVYSTIIQPVINGVTSAFNSIKSIATGLWNGIKNIFSTVGSWFSSKFQEAYNGVKNVFNNIANFFGGIWNTIKSKFTSLGTAIGDAISNAVKSGINGVISLIEGTINKAIGLINGAIDLINLLPGVSVGKINELSLPRLAKGDVALPNKPYFAMLGDNKTQKEVISPVDTMHDTMMDALTDFTGARSNKTETIQQENTKVLSLLEKYLPIIERNMGYNIVLDDDTLVGKITPKIDKGLGILATSKRRGR